MSSHWEWAKRMVEQHDAEKPFAPENGQPLKFGIDDSVIFTNDAGIEFKFRITGFYRPSPNAMYAAGARYLVNSDSPWFPVKESALRLDQPAHPDFGSF